jgi:hypothetical protein
VAVAADMVVVTVAVADMATVAVVAVDTTKAGNRFLHNALKSLP